jgi:hypothetical protein
MAVQAGNEIRNSVFVKTYLIGLAAVLLLLPVVGFALAAEIGIVLFWGLQLLLLIFERISNKAWVRLVVEFLPPLVLWLLFGFGGILAILRVEGWDRYSTYNDLTVVLTTIFMLLGSYAYLFGIRIALGKRLLVPKDEPHSMIGKIRLLLLAILLIDWSVRLHKNFVGVYVNWVAKSGYFSEIERGVTNAFYMLQSSIGMVSIPLLVYLSMADRRKWLFRILLLIQFTLIFLEGDRSELLTALVIGMSTFAMIRGIYLRRQVVLFGIVAIVIFFGVIGPIIQESRLQMRRDIKVLVEQKNTIPLAFLTVYVRESADINLFTNRLFLDDLMTRFGSYSFYAASIHQSLLDQKVGLLIDDFLPTMTNLVPRVISPNKGIRSSNYIMQSHFQVGRAGLDAHGTPVVDIFGYIYLPGIMALMFVSGLGFGLIVRYLSSKHALFGELVVIGMIPVILPLGDSFIGYLSGYRNSLILLLIVILVDFVYRASSSITGTSSMKYETVEMS